MKPIDSAFLYNIGAYERLPCCTRLGVKPKILNSDTYTLGPHPYDKKPAKNENIASYREVK